jgi:hypothetical protein
LNTHKQDKKREIKRGGGIQQLESKTSRRKNILVPKWKPYSPIFFKYFHLLSFVICITRHYDIEKHKKSKKNGNKGPREGNSLQALIIIMTPLKTKLSSTRNS